MRVLLAEDSRLERKLLQRSLGKWGYDAVLAEDGEQAWRALGRADTPSLALLDWMMPGLDGLEVCRRVRQAAREPYIYIILLTGRNQVAMAGEWREPRAAARARKGSVRPGGRAICPSGRKALPIHSTAESTKR